MCVIVVVVGPSLFVDKGRRSTTDTHIYYGSHYYHDEFFQQHPPGSLELEEMSKREKDNYIQVGHEYTRIYMCVCLCMVGSGHVDP